MFDLMTTTAIVDELSFRITGGRVQAVGLRDRESVVIEFYSQQTRQRLVATLGGREPACYLTSAEVRPDPEIVTPLSLLLRKHLRGAMVAAVSQPPLDRIVQISLAKLAQNDDDENSRDDDEQATAHSGEITYSTLSIELMGRRSNVILVSDEGIILESLKRVTSFMSGVRPVLPQRPFSLPPMGDRIDPRQVGPENLTAAMGQWREGDDLSAWLVRTMAGLSPQMAREIAFRATGQSRMREKERVDARMTEIALETRLMFQSISEGAWRPVVYHNRDEELVAYAAQPMRHLVEENGCTEESRSSVSGAIEEYRGAALGSGRHAGRRDRLLRSIDAGRKRAQTKLHALQQELEAAEDGDRYRRWGEAIFANLWAIEPGQDVLELEGERIPLDPSRSPGVVAQEYFSEYRKAGRGREQLGPLIADATAESGYLDQLFTLTSIAESFDEIEALRKEWEASSRSRTDETGGGRHRRPSKKPAAPKPHQDVQGNLIYVGRSGQANETITFDIAGPRDYWLHARGVPGAHVILRPVQIGQGVSDLALEQAASLAAFYSAARENVAVEVDICRRADVRKIKGAGPGMVTYRNERTVRVRPRSFEGFTDSRAGQ